MTPFIAYRFIVVVIYQDGTKSREFLDDFSRVIYYLRRGKKDPDVKRTSVFLRHDRPSLMQLLSLSI